MTNEKEIIINGNIPYDLSIKMFGEADATSKETNLSASVKLIDSKGTVYDYRAGKPTVLTVG